MLLSVPIARVLRWWIFSEASSTVPGLRPGALRQLSAIRCGFAAGCEAGLRPAAAERFKRGLRPWFEERDSGGEAASSGAREAFGSLQWAATPAAKPHRTAL